MTDSPNAWQPVRTEDGSWTLAHPEHGEACHSRSGAWTEARERYASPCRLARRAGKLGGRPLRLLDVGTGLGLNLAAALEAVEGEAGASLDVLALEREREVLERAAGEWGPERLPPEAERWHEPVRRALTAALEAGDVLGRAAAVPLGGRSRLRLGLGDATRLLPLLGGGQGFDAVFLDPFSPRVEPELWTPGFLDEVARRMAPESLLSTFTVSLGVRAALRAAGLRVGPGPRVGAKREGTLASPDLDLGRFDPRTERRVAARAGRPAGEGPGPGGGRGRKIPPGGDLAELDSLE